MFTYPHQRFLHEKITLIAREKRVYDIGGGARFQKWLGKYEPLFKDTEYKTVDYDASTKPDVVGDIHALPMTEGSADAIICYAVLAHVADPLRAVEEMRRVLAPGGGLLVYVPSIYPYMARHGHYPDNWRFFDDTLNLLFKDFSSREQVKVGGYFRALSYFVPYQHKLRWFLDPLAYALDAVLQTERRSTTSGYIVYAVK
jgi:SAM-dependent methyltransferase